MGVTTVPTTRTIAPSRWLVRLAWANLVANIVIVVTGGAVRLTGSGLGCPTWPECQEGSLVPHGAMSVNKAIEFGNRTLFGVLFVIAVSFVIAAWSRGRRERTLGLVVAFGVPAQAVLGGITVLTDLNPWVVALHLLVSMAIIGVCVTLLDLLVGRPRAWALPRTRRAALATFVIGWVVLYLGTVVTGSGPHSGDLQSRRTGLDPGTMSHVHAWAVYALVALTIATLVLARRDGNVPLRTAALALLAAEAVQGVIGYTQYFLDLPILLVLLHMLGAALIAAALAWLAISTRAHRPTR